MASDAKWARHSIGTAVTALRYALDGDHLPRREAETVREALAALTGQRLEQPA